MQRRRNGAAWLGLGLGLLGLVSYFALLGLGIGGAKSFLRDSALIHLVLVGVGLGCSVVGIRNALERATHRGRVAAPLLGVLNLGVAVFFLVFLFRFSALPDADEVPQVGRAAPDFTLTDDTGQPLQLAALRGKNVLLVFYRGYW
jgi:hypothetical protein